MSDRDRQALVRKWAIHDLERQEEEHERALRRKYVEFSESIKRRVKKLVLFGARECSKSCALRGYQEVAEEEYDISCVQIFPVSDGATQTENSLSSINNWQTRILILKPGRFSEDVKAELCTVDLVHGSGAIYHERQIRIEYEALSYFWGDPTLVQSVQCNGKSWPVPRNVYSALKRLRLLDQERYLWIDAICIDQTDSEERSMQVSNMLLIYQKARKVIVWLGEQRQNAALVMDCFNLDEPEICNEHSNVVCQGVLDLLSRAWFRRVWVKQEVWAANEVEVVCGDSAISWELFEVRVNQLFNDIDYWVTVGYSIRKNLFLNKTVHGLLDDGTVWTDWIPPEIAGLQAWFSKVRNPLSDLQRASNTRRALISVLGQEAEEVHALLRSSKGTLNPLSDEIELLKVLIRTSKAECSDLRDHVYAVLGMTGVSHGAVLDGSGTGHPTIIINYNLSVAQVYQDVIRYYLARDSSLWIFNALLDSCYLCQGLTFGDTVENEELPSWCPNWNVALDLDTKSHDCLQFRGDNDAHWGQHGFACELRTKCSFPFSDTRNNVLRLVGLRLPAIKWVADIDYTSAKSHQVQTCKFETHKYPQVSSRLWAKRQSDKKDAPLENYFRRLNKLGDSAKLWSMTGRAPFKDDTLVAVEGSLAPLVVRHQGRSFEFIGIAVNQRVKPDSKWDSDKQEEILSKAIDTIQDLLIVAKKHDLLDTFDLL